MAGGLIQLVAYGSQDLFITHDPQITFFKIVYRRHTNFTLEVIPQNFIHTPDFGKRVTCVLSRNGDLIRKIHVVIDLPTIPQFKNTNQQVDSIAKFAWVRRIGFAIIKSVDIEIGGELIDRQYGDWLNIWYELSVPNRKNINKMIGDIDALTSYSNGKQTYRLYIPLQFWFNKFSGLALPIVSLQYNHIKINLELSEFNKCYRVNPSNFINVDNSFVNFIPYEYLVQNVGGVISTAQFMNFDLLNRSLYIGRISDNGFKSVTVTDVTAIDTNQKQYEILYAKDAQGNYINNDYFITGLTSGFQAMPRINAAETIYTNNSINFNNIVLPNAFLLVEYGFLDDEERIRFSKARHEYLIEQLFFTSEDTINGLNQSFKIGFTQACKELIWVTQLTLAQNLRNNDWFNYTDSMIRDRNDNTIGKNLIRDTTILFNGHERISLRDNTYFSKLQIYQNHTHSAAQGIGVYAFSLAPEKHQPAGTANLSRIDNVNLKINVEPIINFNYTGKLRIYGVMYNVLRIANGISGLVFSIDY